MIAHINIWAVLVAALMTFLVGGLWYSKAVFGRIWGREAGVPLPGEPGAEKKPGHPARVFGLAFLFSLVAAFLLAYFLGPKPPLERAVETGALAGAGFVAASFGINYQFANRSFKLWLIDGGYHVVQFTLFGVVLGIWN